MTRNYIQTAERNAERMREEYIGTIYGVAGLSYMTSLCATEAEDMMRERCPSMATGRMAGRLAALRKAFTRLRLTLEDNFSDKAGAYWAADFGNATYERVRPLADRLQVAVANHLGRYRGIEDINVCARLVVAQSMAGETDDYLARRKRMFRGYSMVTSHGRTGVALQLSLIPTGAVRKLLAEMVGDCVGRHLPQDADLLADPAIRTGCKAMLNMLSMPDMWAAARDKADELQVRNME